MDRPKIDLRKAEQRIMEAGLRKERLLQVAKTLPEVDAEDQILSEKSAAVVDCYGDEYARRNGGMPPAHIPTSEKGECRFGVVLWIGAIAVMVLDATLSAILAKSWFAWEQKISMVAGVGIALALSFAAKGGIAKLVADPLRPLKARRWSGVITALSFVVSFALAWVLLASRNPSEWLVDYLITYGGLLLGGLSITLAFFAGSLMVGAEDFLWSRRWERDFQWIAMRRGKLAGFRNWTSKL